MSQAKILDVALIQKYLKGDNIKVGEIIDNTKSSEKYIQTTYKQDNGFEWETYVPFYSRWSALFLEDEKDIADHVRSLKPYFIESQMREWKMREWAKWKENKGTVTKYVFKTLLSFKGEYIFPLEDGTFSDNLAKRIQEIKNAGYTLASVTVNINGKKKTNRILLPIPLNTELGYEVFTKQFKTRVIRLLNSVNAYEAKPTSTTGLIPDHKFSEVRWDDETKGENPMTMTDEEIINKFQLLDNQRNQQKREVCRKCFQDNIRGTIYGIKYFYKGNEKWDSNIPKVGKEAEKGCEGCPWYDIETWRKKLNEKLK